VKWILSNPEALDPYSIFLFQRSIIAIFCLKTAVFGIQFSKYRHNSVARHQAYGDTEHKGAGDLKDPENRTCEEPDPEYYEGVHTIKQR
jgi:hypothetical protein